MEGLELLGQVSSQLSRMHEVKLRVNIILVAFYTC